MISAIIPARNEETSIARAVESVASQPEIGELIVVNDQSTDRTAAILSELSQRIPKLKVLETDGLPAGWTGKNYAVSLGANVAQGNWLLFTDADTYHLPGSAQRALEAAKERNAILVSYSPDQEMETFWERSLIPFVYCRLAAKYPYARVNNSKRPDAAANGQYLLVRRDAYDAVGGHRALAREILEDVALARRIKQAGYKIYFDSASGFVRTRMYRSFGTMWEGWTKNLYVLVGGTALSALRQLVVPAIAPIAAIGVFLWVWAYQGRPIPAWLVGVLILAELFLASAVYGIELYRNLLPVSYIKYYIPGVCLWTAALAASWWNSSHDSVAWKGRRYKAKAP